MPSLLQKLSFFDPESGRYFIVADDGFYWKEGKKSPQDSKVTRLMQQYGWELKHGNDVWLIFSQRGQRGEVTVTRGSKEWYYDQPTTGMFESDAEGVGLESLHQALESGALKPKSRGMTAANSYVGPERRRDFKRREQFDRESMYSVSLGLLHKSLADSADLAEQQEIKQEIARLEEMRDNQRRTGSAATTAVNNAGNGHKSIEDEPHCDDGWDDMGMTAASRHQDRSGKLTPKAQAAWDAILASGQDKVKYNGAGGAILQNGTKIHSHLMTSLFAAGLVNYVTYDRETGKTIDPEFGWHFTVNRPQEKQSHGLMSRPDYKVGAVLALSGRVKTASGVKKAELYISDVTYEQSNSFKLASFKFTPSLGKAIIFSRYTAANLQQQIEGFGVTAQMIIAKPGDLLTTQNTKTQKAPRPELLTQHNLKTQKGESKGFLTGVMHMMPSDLAGYGNVCPCASPECRKMCLNTAGVWANAPAVQNSRRMKTELYFKNRPQFMADMRKSIAALVRKADREGLTPAVRINGTSDLPQVSMEMAKEFPNVQFYDYTKIPRPWERQLPNYHITFSRSEINEKDAIEALKHGVNVAVVFNTPKGQPFPADWMGYKVLDGDQHDLRFLDKLEGDGPFVIGLRGKGKAKGKAKGTESGFVVDPEKAKAQQQLYQIGPAPTAPAEPIEPHTKPPAPEEEDDDEFLTMKEEPNPLEQGKESSLSDAPHNEWFIEGCFDDAHLYV